MFNLPFKPIIIFRLILVTRSVSTIYLVLSSRLILNLLLFFIDKKLAINTPQLKPRAISPHSEEHQYDIPFGHLNKSSNQRIISDHQRINTGSPEHYDDMELSRQRLQQQQQQQRKSRTSNRTSSSTSHSK